MNGNWAWRYIEKIDIKAADTTGFDTSISKRYIDIFDIEASLLHTGTATAETDR